MADKKGGGPKPPTASEQFDWFKKATEFSSGLNAIDQNAPWGSTTYNRNKEGVPTEQNVTLGPDEQKYYESSNKARQGFIDNLPGGNFRAPSAINTRMPTNMFGFSDKAKGINTGMPMGQFGYSGEASGIETRMPTDMFSAPDNSRADKVGETLYKRRLGMIDQDLKSAEDRKRQELAERGIPIGSEVYRDEYNRLDESRGNTLAGLAQDAELAAGAESDRILRQAMDVRGQQFGEAGQRGAEQSRQFAEERALQGQLFSDAGMRGAEQNRLMGNELALRDQRFDEAAARGGEDDRRLARALTIRNQPFNEWASFTSGAPVTTPNFRNDPAYSTQAPDLMGPYNAAQNQYNQNQSSFWNGLFGLGSSLAPMIFSDIRLKEDIDEVGEITPGVSLYTFKYRGEDGPGHVGVMAQEAEIFDPEVVAEVGAFKAVDYSKLATALVAH